MHIINEVKEPWVEHRNMEAMKRLTVDIPIRLHAKLKARCAMRGTKMADEIREWLEKEVG